VLNANGRAALRQPPMSTPGNRLSIARVEAWQVCGDDRLSFTATRDDLFRKNVWTENYLFKSVDGAWRFHDHAVIDAQTCR
jgi:uncharacterized protein YchJ